MKQRLNKNEKRELLAYIKERFGIGEELFENYGFFRTKEKFYICSEACVKNEHFGRAETGGLAFARPNKHLKPTTDMLQLFGKHAKKNIAELGKEYAEKFIRGEDIIFDKSERQESQESQEKPAAFEEGFVIVKYKGHILGCANFSRGSLKNLIPKSRRVRIKWEL